MNKEVISDKQGICVTVLSIIGTSIIIVMGLDAERDIWIANILSIFMALPVVIIYSRLQYIFQGKDLFDILVLCFGKFLGKMISVLYIWFAFHIGVLIISDYGHFIKIVSLPETPEVVPSIAIAILGIWAVKEGSEVLGRWAEFFTPIIILFISMIILFSIPNMNLDNIQPVLSNGIKPVLKGAFYSFAFPYAETIILTMFFAHFKTRKSPFKVYITGLIIGGIILVIFNLATILVLDVNTISRSYYPSFNVASRIYIRSVLQRLESIATIVFLIGGFIKMSICLLSVCKGISKLFDCNNYRFIVTPIALLMGVVSLSIDSIIEVIEFASTVSPYYKFSFQVIIPIALWITAEIKKRQLA